MQLEQNRYKMRLKSHHDSSENFKYLIKGSKTLSKQLNENYKKNKKGAIYVHVPFCKKICTFCNMRRNLMSPPPDYADLVVKQIENYSKFKYITDSKYDAVYFGGGTPTALDSGDLRKILRAIRNYLPLTEDCEITIETTISELSDDKIGMFYEEGVNRFSIGVQTFSDNGRAVLGRIGKKEVAIERINKLKEIGFSNVNIDIIYNYPEETLDEAIEDINTVIDLDLAGFSFYSLIINEKATLGKIIGDSKDFYERNFEREKMFFNGISKEALKNGFKFLELTKIVKPDRDKYKYIVRRHNGEDTLPIGAGAGGYIGNTLVMNSLKMDSFREEVKNIENISGMEVNSYYDLIKMVVGQVQMANIDLNTIEDDKNREIVKNFIKELEKEDFVEKVDDKYNLTTRGVFWGNNISNEISSLLIRNIFSSLNNTSKL
ncbi:radical SAM protein [Sporanaerobacter acetigenes]|uniref:Heme chaperone HemW n=1 Tax=Sporanaerobacter acetigenes DSM 13106 TaxID=1123281 RepID=A0A1M5VQX1_9FIRM|nr:radical SAM protein [Sporanaerobacter acetigenes]SHH77645.1 oxygen-independent coproporphyrinogen-3 oxidase [Sporanaerobacter acetigenes DSM 13106]